MIGFSGNIGSCSIMLAELYDIWFGMKLALEHGVQRLHVESNSQSALIMIEKGCHSCHPCAPILHDIMCMQSNFAQIRWSHTIREASACADAFEH